MSDPPARGLVDDAGDLARHVAAARRPLLVATDVDGTIADITATPEAASLRPGALEALRRIRLAGHHVAVLSGRPHQELRHQFGLTDEFVLIGSHGAEAGGPAVATARESAVLAAVHEIVERVAQQTPGARIERKPFAVALHVRRVEAALGDDALDRLRHELDRAQAVTLLEGHRVLEVSVRPTSKATAMAALRRRLGAATVVFIGDDRSDEGVFAELDGDDLGVKVGPEPTLARRRLAGPEQVVAMLTALAELVAPTDR